MCTLWVSPDIYSNPHPKYDYFIPTQAYETKKKCTNTFLIEWPNIYKLRQELF